MIFDVGKYIELKEYIMFKKLHSKLNLNSNSILALFSKSYVGNKNITFEKFSQYFSFIGPLLFIVYAILIIPYFLEYNSLANYTALHQFAERSVNILLNLVRLLSFAVIFSGLGMLLGIIHKNYKFFLADLFSFLLSVGFVFPTLIIAIGN